MPSISTGKILVSGANGYVALWVVDSLLKRGFSIRATVRSIKKSQHLLDLYKSYGDQLEFVIVEDITKEGAFDEAVRGIDAIMHMASPFTEKNTKVEEFVRPAVDGTVGILKSAAKYSQTIKRIVITSSIAAVMDIHPIPSLYTEKDWNIHSPDEIKKLGDEASVVHMYMASKSLAERAAWDCYNSLKGSIGWDLVTILPGIVFGPMLQEISQPSELNQSMEIFFKALMSGTSTDITEERVLTPVGGWVDVRDVAEMHALVLTTEEAKDERFLAVAGSFCAQEIVNAAQSINPKIPNQFPKVIIPPAPKRFDSSKSKKVLGIRYKTLEETTGACLKDFSERQWI